MKKSTLLIIGTLAMGLLIFPSALGLLTGTHTYTSPETTNCIKCHSAEGSELADSTYHQFVEGGNTACMMCHNKDNTPEGEEGHSAVTIPCTFCHNGVLTEITSEHEAHKNFYLNAVNESMLEGGNEACIACHTCIGFEYTPTQPEILTYDASTNVFGTQPVP